MSVGLHHLDARLFPIAPPERLAMLRIVTGTWATLYLAIRLPVFLALAQPDRGSFKAIGVLSMLGSPMPSAAVTVFIVATLVSGVMFTTGVAFRLFGPLFAIALLLLTTYRSSWGQVLWFETLPAVHLLIVGFAPSADALVPGSPHRATVGSRVYGTVVRVAAVVTICTYFLSGIAKLRIGGLAWMSGESLQTHVAYSAARLDLLGATRSPIASWIVSHPSLLTPVAVVTVVLELGAPFALFGRRWSLAWVAAMWLLHVGIAVSLLVVWGYPLWGVAFAPLFRLERLARRRLNSASTSAAVVANTCSSVAAMTESAHGAPAASEAPAGVTIVLRPNGPMLVKGDVTVIDTAGNEIDRGGRVAFCRCGASKTKPFCDASHQAIGFEAP